jgi:hypothetical protein
MNRLKVARLLKLELRTFSNSQTKIGRLTQMMKTKLDWEIGINDKINMTSSKILFI